MTERSSSFVLLVAVYLSFLMDNILLTVVVPIIPDYLFSSDLLDTSRLGPSSLSPLQQKYEHLERDNGPLGALLASKSFVQLAVTPIIGHLTGFFGFTTPLLLGSCNMLLASILFAYGKSYGILVFARALHGSASAAISVCGMCLLAATVPKESRSKLMPLAFGGIALGVLIGYPLGGFLNQIAGKTAPFLLIAALISVNIVLQILFVKKPDFDEIHADPISISEWTGLLKDPQTLITTGAICVCTCAMAVLESCLPLWLMGRFDPPPSKWQLGVVFLPDSFGYFLGSHCAGLIPVKAWRIALSSLVLAGLSSCAVPMAMSINQLSIPHFGLGLGVGAVDAILVPMLANLVDRKQSSVHYGPVYALQQTAVNLAYLFGPLIGGTTITTIGFPWLMRIVGLLNITYCSLLVELETTKSKPLLSSNTFNSYSTLDASSTPSSCTERRTELK